MKNVKVNTMKHLQFDVLGFLKGIIHTFLPFFYKICIAFLSLILVLMSSCRSPKEHPGDDTIRPMYGVRYATYVSETENTH